MAKAQADSDSGGWSEALEKTWTFALRGVQDPQQSIRPDAVTLVRSDSQTQTFAATKTHRYEDSRHRIHLVADFDQPVEHPEFEILGELGTGGMGSVFRARQNSLGRHLALKRLRTDIDVHDALAQFENEARITAILDHPNIVPVHDLGRDQEGRIFYSMKLVQGTPWSEILAARRGGSTAATADGLDLRDHLHILLEVCNAVAFAHSRRILHRDIKPGNVMVGDYGEVLLVDWGLGVSLDAATSPEGVADLSQVSVNAGTPTYMAPETARGAAEQIGTWSDNYSLGAVLFELLYRRPPHTAGTALDAVKCAARNAWKFPDEVSVELRPYHEVLKPVLERALATDPEDRYADTKEFAAALRTALRNLDSATLASSAYADLEELRGLITKSPHQHYHTLARIIGALEKALDSWPENPDARGWLADAHLDHVEASLVTGDLILAGAHLDELAQLPGTALLSGAFDERAGRLRRRLSAALEGHRRRRVRSRVFQAAAVVLSVGLVVLAVTAYDLIRDAHDRVTTERNHLSKLLIRTASDGIESELHGMFDPVRGGLGTAARWARDGWLDSDDPEQLTPLLLPLLDGIPVISLITRADSAGREYMIMRTPDGWRVRLTNPGEPTKWLHYLSTGTLVDTYTEELDYDPLTRPWYEGAIELRDSGSSEEVFWTNPYVFYTGKQPGITASIPVTSSSGREFVIGFDILLSEISEFTVEMPDARHGKVFVLTEGDQVIGLPRAPQFSTAEARKQAVLTPLLELGDPVSAAALQAWDELGRPQHEPLRFVAQAQPWWTGFRAFELAPGRRFWIGRRTARVGFLRGRRVIMRGFARNLLGAFAIATACGTPSAGGPAIDQVAAGTRQTCVRFDGGRVRCWGKWGSEGSDVQNGKGLGFQEPLGDDEPASAGPEIDLGGVVVTELALGGGIGIGLTEAKGAVAWGVADCVPALLGPEYGAECLDEAERCSLGDADTAAFALDLSGEVKQVDITASAGCDGIECNAARVCAVLEGATVRCWGEGVGYPGLGCTVGDDESIDAGPLEIGGGAVEVAAGGPLACARTVPGHVRCWGMGDLGYEASGGCEADCPEACCVGVGGPPEDAGDLRIGGEVQQLAAGNEHVCALIEGGRVRCWGRGSRGELGYPGVEVVGDDETPVEAGDVEVGGRVLAIDAGYNHTCALLQGGGVRCWGSSDEGQLGYGNTQTIGDDEAPAVAGDVEVGEEVVQLSTGLHHTCALTASGGVRCWGMGEGGRLGYGDEENVGDDETPADKGDVPVFP